VNQFKNQPTHFMKSSLHLKAFHGPASLALLLLAATAQAQVIQIAPRLVPAAPPANEAPPAPPQEGQAPVNEAPPANDLGKALRTMKFDRSADALLAATRAQRKGTQPTPAEEFSMSVMLGDWTAVGKTLASLSPEDAGAGYTRLLDSLAAQAIGVDAVLKPSEDGASEDEDPRDRAMQQMKEREDTVTSKISYEVGDKVKVADGPFQNQQGIVEEVDPERGKLRVSVSIFGRDTPVELEYWQVEKA
jgi:hypothetical protein